MRVTVCPFCLPERLETQHAMVSSSFRQPKEAEEHFVTPGVRAACLSSSSPLLIIIIGVHGVLVSLFDLGDESALRLPVADNPVLVSKAVTTSTQGP